MIGRRTMLAGVGLLGTGALGYGGSLLACAGRDRIAMIEPLFQLVSGFPAPDRIGRAWLGVERPERVVAGLMANKDLMRAAVLPGGRMPMAEAIREEFRRGDTVLADRWVLARSEARIAAAWVLYRA